MFENRVQDKIVHASFDGETELLYLVFAHNFCEVWDMNKMEMKERRFCEEECILYSADFHLESKMIIGGTVFRSVLLWSIASDIISDIPAKVLYKLEGHTGVIFDVKFLTHTKVASVSDDRTLRVWDLQ